MIYQILGALALVASTQATLHTTEPHHLKELFDQFKSEYGKRYETMTEELNRFDIFVNNLKVIDERNAAEKQAGGTAVHSINKFADLTQTEFEARFLRSDISMRTKKAMVADVPPVTTTSTKDWSGVYTTPVKDQGYCGSCWAFSATEQIESDYIRVTGGYQVLSPEQITQCDKTSYGCNGGWTERAYNYVARAGGIETNSDYPYTSYSGVTGSCSADSSKFAVAIDGYYTISGETNMANYVLGTGPLSICVDASNWSSYTGGILTVCGNSVNHCVQAVGVDTSSAWKVRNSWGTSWGEAGYIYLAYGRNTCDLTSDPTYVTGVRDA